MISRYEKIYPNKIFKQDVHLGYVKDVWTYGDLKSSPQNMLPSAAAGLPGGSLAATLRAGSESVYLAENH